MGDQAGFQQAADGLRNDFGFDFVAVGLAEKPGAPLRWLYSSGATGERYKRIVLSPGHGIGGIVLKSGKPMMFTDIDRQLDPREYSSYPIVFAEDLRSFCALPLGLKGEVAGVLLCAFRSSNPAHEAVFERLTAAVADGLCGYDVTIADFLRFSDAPLGKTLTDGWGVGADYPLLDERERARLVGAAQEEERRRMSRMLHDELSQEMLSVSMLLKQARLLHDDDETTNLLDKAETTLARIVKDVHNLSVQLRPLALDDLGLIAALRSHAGLCRSMYGVDVAISDATNGARYDSAIETHAYRIAQEAMTNACKYSGVDAISVALVDADGVLTLSVFDQGSGFDTARPEIHGTGCGIPGMRERASLIGGELEIRSASDGTVVTLRVPTGEQVDGPVEQEASVLGRPS